MTKTKESDRTRLFKAMSHKAWKKHCRSKRATFSSITTYLAQFMAHDLVFSAVDSFDFYDLSKPVRKTNNLRQAPLRLETLYGQGRRESPYLYGAHGISTVNSRMSFELNRFTTATTSLEKTAWAPAFTISVDSESRKTRKAFGTLPTNGVPVLGDMRNADHPIIMSVAIAFMRLHNLLVSFLPSKDPTAAFEAARILVTRVYHDILWNDVLEPLRPVKELPNPAAAVTKAMFEGADPVHGVMRALHALPLDEYVIHKETANTDKRQRLGPLLSSNAVKLALHKPVTKQHMTEALQVWWREWGVDLAEFIQHEANKTNVMPTLPIVFEANGLTELDRQAAIVHQVSDLKNYAGLLTSIKTLYSDITRETGLSDFPNPASLPVSLVFLVEAYGSDPETGGLGPVGFELFSSRVGSLLAQAELPASISPLRREIRLMQSEMPDTFKGLIDYLELHERNQTS